VTTSSRKIDSSGTFTNALARTADYIARTQAEDGAIPWFPGSIVDPWDHVEAAMGLAIGGYVHHAERAYHWLIELQRDDGSWLAAYQGNKPADATRAETNFVAYFATGAWHQYLVTGNKKFLRRAWPTVRRACDFVLALQTQHGDIHWAVDSVKGIDRDALVTGCSSIYLSLQCAARIAGVLGEPAKDIMAARYRLGEALRNKPERFDRTWESKARYSMDWFYPVLTGVVRGQAASNRLQQRWDEFIEPGVGCQRLRAQRLFADLARFQHEDGSWWTGYVTRDDALWPEERPTWTAGAVLLAADTLSGITGGSKLFGG